MDLKLIRTFELKCRSDNRGKQKKQVSSNRKIKPIIDNYQCLIKFFL